MDVISINFYTYRKTRLNHRKKKPRGDMCNHSTALEMLPSCPENCHAHA